MSRERPEPEGPIVYPVAGPAATGRGVGGVAEAEMLARLARLMDGPPA